MDKPNQIRIRAYQVGFGDCFLLTFYYPGSQDRHVLIDFGAHPKPKEAGSQYMREVAESIQAECGGRLDAIFVSHRHSDHLSGFDPGKHGGGPGEAIAQCQPRRIVQPWTEHPWAETTAEAPPSLSLQAQAFVYQLHDMERVAEGICAEAHRLACSGAARGSRALRSLAYYGESQVKNKRAVENLMKMAEGGKARYVSYGQSCDLESILPGVTVHVIGPPTLEQWSKLYQKRAEDEDEYWHLQALASARVASGQQKLFPDAPTYPEADRPGQTGWFVQRLRAARAEQLLQLVTTLDKKLNNTSLILLFEVGQQMLLFPGDAQIENWLYAMNQADDKDRVWDRLRQVTLYKVGHHGSLNGTPKSVWQHFANRDEDTDAPDRLLTILSTMPDVHGEEDEDTEVPRKPLVDALEHDSHCVTTESVSLSDYFWSTVIPT